MARGKGGTRQRPKPKNCVGEVLTSCIGDIVQLPLTGSCGKLAWCAEGQLVDGRTWGARWDAIFGSGLGKLVKTAANVGFV